MSLARVMSQPPSVEAVKRWSLGLRRTIVEDPRGRLVLYQDYRRLRLAHDRVSDKLRQVSKLYQTTAAERDAAHLAVAHEHPLDAGVLALCRPCHQVACTTGRQGHARPVAVRIPERHRACSADADAGDRTDRAVHRDPVHVEPPFRRFR